MLPSKTVFVVGAGASAEVGLPIGDKLKREIAGMLRFARDGFRLDPNTYDARVLQVLQQKFPNDTNAAIAACQNISDGVGLSASIDSFLEIHKDDKLIVECGKVAIACAILNAEKSSKLFFDPNDSAGWQKFESIESAWHFSFYEWLAQGVDKSNLDTIFANLTIISFNYDRCIQHFLVHAIAKNYLISIEDASEIVKRLSIFFPYGSIGPYFASPQGYMPFGIRQRALSYDDIVSGIKTYSEQIHSGQTLAAIRTAMAEAKIVVFLGNRYHKNNMDLLDVRGDTLNQTKKYFATSLGIESTEDLDDVKACIYRLLNPRNETPSPIHFAGKCYDLFQKYPRVMRNG